ncbi:MAG: hypothetical protein WCA77_02750 [Thermoplasmata archaeon]
MSGRRPPVPESTMAVWVAASLEPMGFEVHVDPDGSDYFDLVAVRGEEIGLVELKVTDWRTVIRQAVDRRDWADWVAVALPRASLAQRVAERTRQGPGVRIGVWVTTAGSLTVVRPATAFAPTGEAEADHWRHRLRELLYESQGAWPPGELRWSVGRTTPRRGAWRLDDFPTSPAPVGDSGPPTPDT